ncbi:MAG: AtpZ/AtpI family protein [Bacteroidota bacterium]|nr:AtpZ/AtpI family protein [Bacteroidota bacterium]MDX5430708.1 AtpZ/AtpI family protein [Bacteroidota bacterium]MDX5469455.1 AtpZ/AtpI family protein [Bacteroidota bacterium]
MWSITLPLIISVGVIGFLGHLLDGALNLNFPLFTLLGIFAGLIGAVMQILRTLNKK